MTSSPLVAMGARLERRGGPSAAASLAPGTCRLVRQRDGAWRVQWCSTDGRQGLGRRLDSRESALAHARVLTEFCGYQLAEEPVETHFCAACQRRTACTRKGDFVRCTGCGRRFKWRQRGGAS